MSNGYLSMDYASDYIAHYGIKGQKWGVRNYQNADGSLTDAGRSHYGYGKGKTASSESSSNSSNTKKPASRLASAVKAAGAAVSGAGAVGAASIASKAVDAISSYPKRARDLSERLNTVNNLINSSTAKNAVSSEEAYSTANHIVGLNRSYNNALINIEKEKIARDYATDRYFDSNNKLQDVYFTSDLNNNKVWAAKQHLSYLKNKDLMYSKQLEDADDRAYNALNKLESAMNKYGLGSHTTGSAYDDVQNLKQFSAMLNAQYSSIPRDVTTTAIAGTIAVAAGVGAAVLATKLAKSAVNDHKERKAAKETLSSKQNQIQSKKDAGWSVEKIAKYYNVPEGSVSSLLYGDK